VSPHDISLPVSISDTTLLSHRLDTYKTSANAFKATVAQTVTLEVAVMATPMASRTAVATGPLPTVILAEVEAMVVVVGASVALGVIRCPSSEPT